MTLYVPFSSIIGIPNAETTIDVNMIDLTERNSITTLKPTRHLPNMILGTPLGLALGCIYSCSHYQSYVSLFPLNVSYIVVELKQ